MLAASTICEHAAIYGGMKPDLLLTVPLDYYKNGERQPRRRAAVIRAVQAHGQNGAATRLSTVRGLAVFQLAGLAKVEVNGLTQHGPASGGMKIRTNATHRTDRHREATRAVTPAELVHASRCRGWAPEYLRCMCLFLLSDSAS